MLRGKKTASRTVKLMQKGISVMLPVKNSEQTIGKAVSSILSAMSKNDELLVCEDASSDSTASILRQIRDSRVKVFELSESIGPGLASNFLARESQKELLARVDGDDIVLPNRFAERFRRMAGERREFVFSNMVLFGRGWMMPQRPRAFAPEAVPRALVLGNPLNNPTLICPRDIYLESGGYTQGVGCDKALWLTLALRNVPMRVERSYTVMYRVHPNQRSRSPEPKDPAIQKLEESLVAKLEASAE